MKYLDQLMMSISNLRRRKLRTALTVLGVVVGTASIVVMMSLGIGLQELMTEQVASYGSLTEITVYSNSFGGGQNPEEGFLKDDTVKQFAALDHVSNVTPMLDVYTIFKQGVYEAGVRIRGVNQEYLQKIPLKEGRHTQADAPVPELIVGNMVGTTFYNPKAKNPIGYPGDQQEVVVDFLNTPVFVIFDTGSYQQPPQGDSDKPATLAKKYLLPTVGLIAGEQDEWNNHSYSVYTDIDLLKSQLKKIFRKGPIPNQPTNKKGKPYNYFVYDEVIVEVEDMNYVTDVQKAITDMGFQASSNMEWLDASKKQAALVQAVLGGIGAVSLFVAAIGIANTMMMSIYERTREIGVIKVLGCDMRNIRNMFLMESGFIGFMGGGIGLLLSYMISFLVNHFLAGGMLMMVGEVNGSLSRIPLWLSGCALVFAILVGMLAGLFPSLRAMKLSPLAAIRND